ncbi:MAG: carboxyl transferase domain-containing protein, partial [Faecalispora jeddahensis]
MENTTRIQEMLEKKAKIMQGGGPQRVQKQHAAGKLTARERLDLLFDPGTFQEYNIFMKHRCHDFGMEKVDTPAEGVVTGYGLVNGRGVFAFAHDFTVLGGAMGEMQGMKVKRIQELALDAGVPFVGLNDSGGGRIQEGPATSYGAIFYNNVMASGVIPQISAVMGPCAGSILKNIPGSSSTPI